MAKAKRAWRCSCGIVGGCEIHERVRSARIRFQEAVDAVVSMNAPSVADILRGHGYDVEAELEDLQNATPRPWRLFLDGDRYSIDHEGVYLLELRPFKQVTTPEERDANAALIVTAVNDYNPEATKAMVEAAQMAIAALQEHLGGRAEMDAMNALANALAQQGKGDA